MISRTTSVLLVVGCSLMRFSGMALAVTVPDDVPTVQQAIDSGADEILVRPGIYLEALRIDRPLVIQALIENGSDERPRLLGLTLDDEGQRSSHSAWVAVTDLHFTGPVRSVFHVGDYSGPLTLVFDRCAMDSGMTDAPLTAAGQVSWQVSNCTIEGDVHLTQSESIGFVGNVVHGHVELWATAYALSAHSNVITGTGGVGLSAGGGDPATISHNSLHGFDVGIQMNGRGDRIEENVVEDCTDTGLSIEGNAEYYTIHKNQIRRCGAGIYSYSHERAVADSNTIEDCRGIAVQLDGTYSYAFANSIRRCGGGIDARGGENVMVDFNRIEACQGDGIIANASYQAHVTDNVVERCLGMGIRTWSPGGATISGNRVVRSGSTGLLVEGSDILDVERNVVGHGGADGLVVASYRTVVRVLSNTSYANDGHGIAVQYSGDAVPSLHGNLAAFNGGHGLIMDPPGSDRSCNDWFANALDTGPPTDPDDLALDPLFCNLAADSVGLRADSPLLKAGACGLVGTLGQGCDEDTPALVLLFSAERMTDGVRLRWRLADPAASLRCWTERAESNSGPWSRVVSTRSNDGEAIVEVDPAAMAGRSYWYRLSSDPGVLAGPVEVAAGAFQFALVGVAPNPTNGPLRIEFTVAHRSRVEIGVLDVQGRHLATLVSAEWNAGRHVVGWRVPETLRSGIYWIEFHHPEGRETRRVCLSR